MNDVELGNGITKCEVDNGLSFFYKIMKKENGAINVEELIKAIEKLYSLFIEANPGIIPYLIVRTEPLIHNDDPFDNSDIVELYKDNYTIGIRC